MPEPPEIEPRAPLEEAPPVLADIPVGLPLEYLVPRAPAAEPGSVEHAQHLVVALLESLQSPNQTPEALDFGRLAGVVGHLLVRVAEQRTANEELRRQNATDVKTGLPNLRGLLDALEDLSPDLSYTAVFIDINSFKDVNKEVTHLGADELLRDIVAQFLRQFYLRDGSLIARYGGDEFVMLVPNVGGTDMDGGKRQGDPSEVATGVQRRIAKSWDDFLANLIVIPEDAESDQIGEPQPEADTDERGVVTYATKQLLDQALQVGFGISVGTCEIPCGASINEALEAIQAADEQAEQNQIRELVTVIAANPELREALQAIRSLLHVVRISARRLPKLLDALALLETPERHSGQRPN